MIVTIRSRALGLPRRIAAWAGNLSQRLLGRTRTRQRALEHDLPHARRPSAAVLSRMGGIGTDLVGQDFAPRRTTLPPTGALAEPAPRRRWPRWPALVVLAVLALSGLVVLGTGYRYSPLPTGAAPPPVAESAGSEAALARENRKLRSQIERVAPHGVYIVVDRANNRLYLKRGDEVVLEAVCSSGSGMVLRDPGRDRRWVFDTPSGSFRVLSKTEDPVWRKPDWAFIEEGLPVPRNPDERIEYGMLGEYGLNFGNGYLIHGTLYERLLGRSVTHGCIRLGRDDLRQVYRAASVGTPIYIF